MRFDKKEITDYIRIFPEKIPYSFQIGDFKYEIFVNTYSNDLYINCYDKNNQPLGSGSEKLIIDFPLFWCYGVDENGNTDPRYPNFNLVPRSTDGKDYPITRENYGKWLLAYEEV